MPEWPRTYLEDSMESGLSNEEPSSIENPHRMLTTDSDLELAALHLWQSRQLQGLLFLVGLPIIFVVWVVSAQQLDLDVVFTARAAMLTAAPIAIMAIFIPLLLRYPKEVRWRGYIVEWFSIALFFNIVWQMPPIVFRSVFERVEYTIGNLPYYVFWWGYHSSDLDYGEMTRFWVLAEVSFWVISVLVVVALVWLWRGRETRAFFLLGVCGALQLYNVLFFIGYGGIVEHFDNIAQDSVIAPILYWVFNLLWGIAGAIASFLCFKCLLHIYKRQPEPGASARNRGRSSFSAVLRENSAQAEIIGLCSKD